MTETHPFEQRPDRQALHCKLRVRLKRVVEIDYEELERLGVSLADYPSRDYSRTQEISDGLNYLGCDGLIVCHGGSAFLSARDGWFFFSRDSLTAGYFDHHALTLEAC